MADHEVDIPLQHRHHRHLERKWATASHRLAAPHDLAKRGESRIGIWSHIWYRALAAFGKLSAERAGATYIDRIRWTPQFERWEIGFEALSQVSGRMTC